MIAEELSAIFDLSADQAYTAALMHDIGRLGLLKSYPAEMTAVLGRRYPNQAAALAAERAAVQLDHGRAGAWLVEHWAYPPEFVRICEYHHDAPHPKDAPMLWLVKVACRMADALEYSAVAYDDVVDYRSLLAGFPAPLQPEMFPSEEELRKNVKVRLAAFELAP